jgi:hypothetical protein
MTFQDRGHLLLSFRTRFSLGRLCTLAQAGELSPVDVSRHAACMRWVWATIVGLSVLVPAALIAYGHHVNVHTTSTVGGPLTEGLSVALAVGFDLLLWLCVAVFLAGRSARRAARDLQNSPPSAV